MSLSAVYLIFIKWLRRIFFPLFGIDEDIIKVYYHKNIMFLRHNLVDVAWELSLYVNEFKKHYLVLKIIVAGLKKCCLFITFFDLYLMLGISQIKLGKISISISLIQ